MVPAAETIQLLHQKFDDLIISQNDNVSLPPRSCNLPPLDIFSGVMLSHKSIAANHEQLMI